MIVDDAAFMRMMIKDIISKNNLGSVVEAENGAVAVENIFKKIQIWLLWILLCRKWMEYKQ